MSLVGASTGNFNGVQVTGSITANNGNSISLSPPISSRGPRGSSAKLGRSAANWTLGALKPGRSATLTLKVRIGRAKAGAIAHTSAAVRSPKARADASGATSIVRRVGKTDQGF